jgi:hypothetical protein
VIVVIVVSAVAVVNAPVVTNNHLLLVKVLAIATIIVARTINTTIVKATLDIASDTPIPLIPLTPTKLHREKTQ